MSLSRCGVMHNVLNDYVIRQEMPGVVALVSCGDETHIEEIGTLAFGSAQQMSQDTIFRIASLSKLVVAVAAMQLIEDCTLRLEDTIDRWLPELANRRVLRSLDAELDDTVTALRPITVRDVLTYRMGMGSIMAPPETYPIQSAVRRLKIGGDGFPRPAEMHSQDVWLRHLGSLPLIAQPGEEWMYHVSGDVLGVLIARASGKSLARVLRDRIFAPLGMSDTSFYVDSKDLPRLATAYSSYEADGKLSVFDAAATSSWAAPPPFESGGGGLVSTVRDYFAFSRMLLRGGSLGYERILSPASISLMSSDQVPAGQRERAGLFFGQHSSWGFGCAVDISRREIYHSPGRFGWTGGFGTIAYVDPKNDAIAILFTQRAMDSPTAPRFFEDFLTTAYSGI